MFESFGKCSSFKPGWIDKTFILLISVLVIFSIYKFILFPASFNFKISTPVEYLPLTARGLPLYQVVQQNSNRSLRLLIPPRTSIGPNFFHRQFFECYDSSIDSIIPLMLCFNILSSVGDINDISTKQHFRQNGMSSSELLLSRITRDRNSFLKNQNKILGTNDKKRQNFYLHPNKKREEDSTFPLKSKLKEQSLRKEQSNFQELTFEFLNYLRISWVVSSGTLLGTLRHWDQIPWDDDTDILVPYHQISHIVGYLSEGTVVGTCELCVASRLWWDQYCQRTTEKERQIGRSHFVPRIKYFLPPTSRRGSFVLKLYDTNALPEHSYSWRFPNFDFFGYEFVDGSGNTLNSSMIPNFVSMPEVNHLKSALEKIDSNESLNIHNFRKNKNELEHIDIDYLKGLTMQTIMNMVYNESLGNDQSFQPHHFLNKIQHIVMFNYFPEKTNLPLKTIFPFHYRPFGNKVVPVINDVTSTASDIPAEDVFLNCYSGYWSHIHETGKGSASLPCGELLDSIPSVTERVNLLIPTSVSPLFIQQPTPPQFLFDLIQQQLNFYNMLNNGSNESPYFTEIDSLPLKKNRRMLSESNQRHSEWAHNNFSLTQYENSFTVKNPICTHDWMCSSQFDHLLNFAISGSKNIERFLKTETITDANEIKENAYIPGVYEVLTVSGYLLGDLIDMGGNMKPNLTSDWE